MVRSQSLLNAVENNDRQALSLAALDGEHVDVLDSAGWSPLMRASEKGHSAIISQLIAYGADVNYSDLSGATAAMIAAICGFHESLAILIGAGANIHDKNHVGHSAAHQSISTDQETCLCVLINAGFDLKAHELRGKSLLDEVRERQWHRAIASYDRGVVRGRLHNTKCGSSNQVTESDTK